MSRYLEEAADLLRNARDELEETAKVYRGDYERRRIAIAREFATLAAIDKGLLPAEMVQDVLRAVTGRTGGA
ncbi:hypothetical protein OEIGOIKO_05786 [Streptomyces chrestomyceticus JCM 4735]|uniref:Uncharacterized protein n=1 Tax=Streptomyces chrestomyceticus JCM 4735 TaxID=1306181 RepID=A0A7U9KYZ1_9ACTN|nr:hypothetical protein [Streptomyces chrestomyceticus]GCD37976.1 hypothetical protein OEIGOIKO_05786 [Streptomyces chrestomyceticus JCM 4735]